MEQQLKIVIDAVNNASEPMRDVSDSLNKLGDQSIKQGKKLSKNITAPLAAVGAVAFETARRTANYADELDKMSIRTGLTTDTLQELRFISGQLGADFSALQSATTTLGRRMRRAGDGGNAYADAVEELGIQVRDSNGEMKGMNELMPDTIRALSEMENETERNAIATELFSKGTAEQLLPLLSASSDEIDQLTERYRELGIEMDEDAIEAGVNFRDTLTEIIEQFKALGREIGNELIPLFNETLFPIMQEQIIPILSRVADTISSVVEWFSNLSEGTQTTIIAVGGLLALIGPLLVGFGLMIKLVAAAASGFALLFSPITLIILAVAALVAAGIWMWQNWEDIMGGLQIVWDNIKAGFEVAVGAIVNFLKKWFVEWPSNVLMGAWENVARGFGVIWESIVSIFSWAKNQIMSFIQPIISAAERAISLARQAARLAGGGVSNFTSSVARGASRISPFADGGVVTGPTLGMVGEAGPEAIIPLDQMGSMGGVSVTINGDVSGEEIVEKVARGLKRNIKETIRV